MLSLFTVLVRMVHGGNIRSNLCYIIATVSPLARTELNLYQAIFHIQLMQNTQLHQYASDI